MSDIAFFRPDTDGRVLPLAYARSLWAPGTLNGPAVCALAAHAAEQRIAEPGFRAARFTIDLFKAAREIPTSTRARVLRSGGRIRVAEVDVVQFPDDSAAEAEVIVARATAVFLRESQNPPGQRWQRDAGARTFSPPTTAVDDWAPRFASDAAGVGEWDSNMGNHQNGLRKRVWTRAAPAVVGAELTPFVRAAISAESTSLICNWGTTGIGFINCDLTVALSRLPRGDRIGVEADSHTEHDGISASTAGLYDVDGMWGVGMVTAVNNAAAEIDFTNVDLRGRYREA
ncbi:thioesterase family protein [Gordonia polyisoprenivorans]|uniref:thioesterase family protein n=1 Tax=Gordonia polyisoprenivorans TaxID=84595 RepID=UPI0019F1AF64|nr:thioesterase family protein [uncultured Gordonia sp.]MBE7193948.1 thioesterase family protein [Gordonia polyisoprenivorans]UZF56980.1 thioesterase family protein [Gordonia polyisoprenivorans]